MKNEVPAFIADWIDKYDVYTLCNLFMNGCAYVNDDLDKGTYIVVVDDTFNEIENWLSVHATITGYKKVTDLIAELKVMGYEKERKLGVLK